MWTKIENTKLWTNVLNKSCEKSCEHNLWTKNVNKIWVVDMSCEQKLLSCEHDFKHNLWTKVVNERWILNMSCKKKLWICEYKLWTKVGNNNCEQNFWTRVLNKRCKQKLWTNFFLKYESKNCAPKVWRKSCELWIVNKSVWSK